MKTEKKYRKLGFLQSLVYPLLTIFEPISLSLVRISSHVWCFGPSATFGDRAGFVEEGDDKEKISVLLSLQELINCNIGKGIGYSGAELQTFVRDQQDRQRGERQLEREARKEDAEREARKEQAEREARKEEAEREARKEEAAAERNAQERKWQAKLNLRNEEVRLQHQLDMTVTHSVQTARSSKRTRK